MSLQTKMENKTIDSVSQLATTKINPSEFDVTVSALLIGVGAEKYVDIFRKRNIGQCTLMELAEEDLIKIGVDDADIRQKLMDEVKNLPIYAVTAIQQKQNADLSPLEIAEVLEDNAQHLYRIYLSMLANSLAVKRTKNIPDCLLYRDKYASDIALATLSELMRLLNAMDITLHTQMKPYTKTSKSNKSKKIIVGTFGGAAIAVLAVMFVHSLRKL